MSGESAEQRWPAARWWVFIGLVFSTQLGLIFWLGRPQGPPPPAPTRDLAPSLQLAGPGASEVLALSDPTLFALPHNEGFSGEAWLSIPPSTFQSYEWSEPDQSLNLVPDDLAVIFKEFAATNQPLGLSVLMRPDLRLKQPRVVEGDPFATRSVLELTGGLETRRLLSPVSLPSGFPASLGTEILTNSVVQVLVGNDGLLASAPVLMIHSGSEAADEYALREARNARFAAVDVPDPANPLAGLTWGQLVFQWRALPLADTNKAPEPAPPK